MRDPTLSTALHMATSIRNRRVSAGEVLDAHLRRIEKVNRARWSEMTLLAIGRALETAETLPGVKRPPEPA